jgi:hypothetical protein
VSQLKRDYERNKETIQPNDIQTSFLYGLKPVSTEG